MLGLFGPKPSHPLADETERKRVLERIADSDALSALKMSMDRLRTLAGANDMPFSLRATLIRQIDEAARHAAHSLTLEYLAITAEPSADDLSLWQASRSFSAQLAATYNACHGDFTRSSERPENHRAELARIAVRLMRAYRTRIKWDRFRSWPASDTLWQNMGRAYLHSTDNGYARREVSAYPGDRRQTTVEAEYLNALVFEISSMDALRPFEVEIADALIDLFSPHFTVGTQAQAGFSYWVDPEQRRCPGRIMGEGEASPSRCYFGTARAVERLTHMQRMLDHGQMPIELDLTCYRSPCIVLPVVRHLLNYWTAHLPERAHNRHRDHSRIAIAQGIDSMHRHLWSETGTDPHIVWVAEDVSLGGVRARLPMGPEDHLRIGTLLGLRPHGGANWLAGVVRRVAREDDMWATAGVETLSRSPIPAIVTGETPSKAILLDKVEEGETVRLAVVDYDPNCCLHVEVLRSTLVLEPVELLEPGADFALGRYRVVGHG